MPESDPLPAPRNITELFPPTRDTLTVLLAIAPRQADGQNTALGDGEANGARFIAEARVFQMRIRAATRSPCGWGART